MKANTTVRALLLIAALLGLGTPALAQQTVQLRNPAGNAPIGDDPSRPLYVSSAGAVSSTPAGTDVGTSWYTDTSTPLASSATFTGTTRDLGAGPVYGSVSYFGCQFNADQTGTATVQNSVNGTTWLTAATQAYTANTALDLNVRVRNRYHRCLFVNGSTAQTSFRVVSSFTAN